MAEQSTPPESNSSAPPPSAPRIPSLIIPDPNIFSDEHAINPFDDPADSAPTTPIDTLDRVSSPSSELLSTPRTSIQIDRSASNASAISRRPRSTVKRLRELQDDIPQRTVSSAPTTDSLPQRGSSTSSRFSIPSNQSPYVGATGPSHPYSLYPQATRASSTSSTSTMRPTDRTVIARTGPEHNYSMYQQNTVPEEDIDVVLPPSSIPLGFPGMGQQYQRGTRQAGDDIADIVGADGHIEELPPYSRYPEGLATKEPLQITNGVVVPATNLPHENPLSPTSSNSNFEDNGVALNVAAAKEAGSESDGSFKERWKEKSRRRVCCGLPIWLLLLVIAAILLVGVLGGIVGAVVGSHSSSPTTPQPDQTTAPPRAAAATSTSYVDASPLPTSVAMPEVPCGQFAISFSPTFSSDSCIVDPHLSSAWDCLGENIIHVSVSGANTGSPEIGFEPPPFNPTVTYGAQLPVFEDSTFTLSQCTDDYAPDLGHSLYFSTCYNKSIILPENTFPATPDKRSVHASEVYARNGGYNGRIAGPGQRPWFCWFNETLFEFFIYADQNETSSKASASAVPTSFVNNGVAYPTGSPPYGHPGGRPTSYNPWGPPPPPPPPKQRRQNSYSGQNGQPPEYPLLIHAEEKRKQNNNVQPYCQQMMILGNQEVVPVPNVGIIQIQESEPPVGGAGRMKRTEALGSNCVCEWST